MTRNPYLKPIDSQTVQSTAQEKMVVNGDYLSLFEKEGLTSFDSIWSFYGGELVKQIKERSVIRTPIPWEIDQSDKEDTATEKSVFFIKKHHQRIGLFSRLFSFWQTASKHSEGFIEYDNFCDFRERGLATAIPVAAGVRFTSFFQAESFLITEDFSPLVDMEELVLNQPQTLKGTQNETRRKNILTAVATYARKMHTCGRNHKDFNATHVLLEDVDSANTLVALFDLQRVDRKFINKLRWPIKALSEFIFTIPLSLFAADERLFFFKKYKGKEDLSAFDRLQYRWVMSKLARITRHAKKRNLAPKMEDVSDNLP